MPPNPYDNIRETLTSVDTNKREGLNTLFGVLYDELRSIAGTALRKENRNGAILETTVLVHEAYLRLASTETVTLQDRAHFLALAARSIRRVLVDHARRRSTAKRGAAMTQESFDERFGVLASAVEVDPSQLLALNDALEELFALHPRQARIVELRFFSGLKETDVAEVLNVSRRTVQMDWAMAKAWLHANLYPEGAEHE